MNIYLVERTDDWGYDNYDSFVCAAENETEAQRMWPSEYHIRINDKVYFNYSSGVDLNKPEKDQYTDWPHDLSKITVKKIGTSDILEKGVVLASFNAG